MSSIQVDVLIQIADQEPHSVLRSEEIPPGYDERDTAALAARLVEDTASQLNQEVFGRTPGRTALIAQAARLKALEALIDQLPADRNRDRLLGIYEMSNDEVIAQFGEDPDGT